VGGAIREPHRALLRVVLGAGRGVPFHPGDGQLGGTRRNRHEEIPRDLPLGPRRRSGGRRRQLGKAQGGVEGKAAVYRLSLQAPGYEGRDALHQHEWAPDCRRQRPIPRLSRHRQGHHRHPARAGIAKSGALGSALDRRGRERHGCNDGGDPCHLRNGGLGVRPVLPPGQRRRRAALRRVLGNPGSGDPGVPRAVARNRLRAGCRIDGPSVAVGTAVVGPRPHPRPSRTAGGFWR